MFPNRALPRKLLGQLLSGGWGEKRRLRTPEPQTSCRTTRVGGVECGQTSVGFESRSRGKNVQVHIRGCWPPSNLEIRPPTSLAPQLALCPCDTGSCCSSYTLCLLKLMDLGTTQSLGLVHSWDSRPIRNQELGGRGGKSYLQRRYHTRNGCWLSGVHRFIHTSTCLHLL